MDFEVFRILALKFTADFTRRFIIRPLEVLHLVQVLGAHMVKNTDFTAAPELAELAFGLGSFRFEICFPQVCSFLFVDIVFRDHSSRTYNPSKKVFLETLKN